MHNPYTVGCTWLRCTDTTCGPKQFFLLNGLMYLSRIFFIYKVHVAAPVVLADVICNCFSQPPKGRHSSFLVFAYIICTYSLQLFPATTRGFPFIEAELFSVGLCQNLATSVNALQPYRMDIRDMIKWNRTFLLRIDIS